MDQAISETDTLMARFRGLLRISELEDRQRRAGFVELDPRALLVELHDFYLPLAEDVSVYLPGRRLRKIRHRLVAPPGIVARARDQFGTGPGKGWLPWQALCRKLDREQPGYRD